jgi:hypothetical protein
VRDGVVDEVAIDDVGESSLECADGLHGGLARFVRTDRISQRETTNRW